MDNKLNGALSSIKKNPFFIGLFVIVLGVVVFVSFTLAKAMNNKIEELEAFVEKLIEEDNKKKYVYKNK